MMRPLNPCRSAGTLACEMLKRMSVSRNSGYPSDAACTTPVWEQWWKIAKRCSIKSQFSLVSPWLWTFFTQMFCITLCVFLKKTFFFFCRYFGGIHVRYHYKWVKRLLKCHFWSFPPFIKAAILLSNPNVNASPLEGSLADGEQLHNGSEKLLTSVVCGEAFPVCNGKRSWHSSCWSE